MNRLFLLALLLVVSGCGVLDSEPVDVTNFDATGDGSSDVVSLRIEQRNTDSEISVRLTRILPTPLTYESTCLPLSVDRYFCEAGIQIAIDPGENKRAPLSHAGCDTATVDFVDKTYSLLEWDCSRP